MKPSTLTFPIARRHDTKFLLDGTVRVEGYDVEFIETGPLPWPYFSDMVTTISYDIGEQALSHYLLAKGLGKPLTAIPVFPSRFFPQMGVAVNRASGIREPRDLVGRRVGVSGFGYNPAVWFRWILQSHYGVNPERLIWVEDEDDPFFAGLQYPRPEKFQFERLPGLTSDTITLKGMFAGSYLQEGRIDAILLPSGGAPATTTTGPLFADAKDQIAQFVASAGVFPINTVITLDTRTVARHRGLPAALYAAFLRAKELYDQELKAGKERIHMGLDIDFLKRIGVFPTSYGLEANGKILSAIVSHMAAENLIPHSLSLNDLFETVD